MHALTSLYATACSSDITPANHVAGSSALDEPAFHIEPAATNEPGAGVLGTKLCLLHMHLFTRICSHAYYVFALVVGASAQARSATGGAGRCLCGGAQASE